MNTPLDRETIMAQWDYWRSQIAAGHKGSAPRDWFESVLDVIEDEKEALMNTCHKCTCPTCVLFTPIGPLRPEIEEELREEQIKKINEFAQKIQKVEPSEIANKEPWKEIS